MTKMKKKKRVISLTFLVFCQKTKSFWENVYCPHKRVTVEVFSLYSA
jgi:hypothetical protein